MRNFIFLARLDTNEKIKIKRVFDVIYLINYNLKCPKSLGGAL